jgi:hypothetical protein
MLRSDPEHVAANEIEIDRHFHIQRVPRFGHEQVGEGRFTVPETRCGSGFGGDDAHELLRSEDTSPGRATADV